MVSNYNLLQFTKSLHTMLKSQKEGPQINSPQSLQVAVLGPRVYFPVFPISHVGFLSVHTMLFVTLATKMSFQQTDTK
jgi:hypothetical protein